MSTTEAIIVLLMLALVLLGGVAATMATAMPMRPHRPSSEKLAARLPWHRRTHER
jgi:hypothetical protein